MKKVDKEFDIDIRVLEKVTKSKLSIAERTDWCG